LQRAVAEADALLIATPEYSYSTAGVLTNAIDCASRPADETPLKGKPSALMGASPGMGGTALAQLALRQTFVFTKTPVLSGPEVAGRERRGAIR
jgi:chromate reductase